MPFLRSRLITEADSCPPSSAEVTNKREGSSTRLYGLVLNQHWNRTWWVTKLSSHGTIVFTVPWTFT